MALVVFLRGVNVGGHRTFRPSVLARELSKYDVVNVGAAGTFVVRKPQSRAKFRAALLPKLPFEADVMLCDGRDLLRLETTNPFGTQPSPPDVVRFVSILSKAGAVRASLPVSLSLRWPVVGAGDGVRRPVRVWHVQAPHEDHRLPRTDRQTLRRACHDTELEHDRCHPANLEGPQQPAVTGNGALPRGFDCNGCG